jgi:SAM-dependent methyltransferase
VGKNLEEITAIDWRRRYQQQAGWTRAVRDYVYAHSQIQQALRVLEVGCGPGVILEDFSQPGSPAAFGIDLDRSALDLAAEVLRRAVLVEGDGLALPFASGSFDHCLCHFLLLWVVDPLTLLLEMKRVLQPGGFVLVLAEPDYGGRVDYPAELAQLGAWQRAALHAQGAQPDMGRQVRALLHQAGLTGVQAGVMGGQWSVPPSQAEWETEWAVVKADFGDSVSSSTLAEYQKKDAAAWDRGERILFVPTFYAWGRAP